ncbi:MAG: hypothetical protein MZV65_17935 [Chromatiales bacterium]|nr:hypothetical protein [Chromatiales bacterium]
MFRATLDTERFNQVLAQMERGSDGDMFLVNRQGVIQTPSRYHGDVLETAGAGGAGIRRDRPGATRSTTVAANRWSSVPPTSRARRSY